MVDGFVDVEKENLCLFLLNEPVFGEIDDSSAIDEEEHLDLVVGAGLLDASTQFRVGGHGVDLVLHVFAPEHLLNGLTLTDSILRVQMESTSTAAKITIET